jgi:L-threonylcarbamoyladenylate synthase
MPSANLSSRPSPTTAKHVLQTLDGRIDAVLCDQDCPVGIESSVVRIDQEKVYLLRPGIISQSELEDILQESIDNSYKKDAVPTSPGQAFLHYAPKISSIVLVDNSNIEKIWSSTDIILLRKIDFKRFTKSLGARSPDSSSMVMHDEPQLFAKQLYGVLYRCEAYPSKRLAIVMPPIREEWQAINDRLVRCAGFI